MEKLIAQQNQEALDRAAKMEAAQVARAEAYAAADKQYQATFEEVQAAEAASVKAFGDALVARASAELASVLVKPKDNNGKGAGK